MVIKQDVDQTTGENFLHIEIETLPHKNSGTKIFDDFKTPVFIESCKFWDK